MNACTRIVPILSRYLAVGGDLPSEVIAHLRQCGDCAATVRRAQLLSEILEHEGVEMQPPVGQDLAPALSQEVLAAVRRRRRLRIALTIAIAAIAVLTWYATAHLMHVRHPYAVWVIQMILFAGPLILVATTAGVDDAAPSRVYKRMRGRQLSGICQGLAEAYRIPVWVVRMAFVALIFLKGAGVIAYLLLDALLPIHPDDRATLLRFRVARWWKQRGFAATSH